MELVVFGGRGRVGSALVSQALDAGHRVAALARAESGLPSHPLLEIIRGDVLDADAVGRAMRQGAVVISVLGGEDAIVRGNENVITAASAAGARRVLGVSGAGVLQADATHLRSEMPDYPPRLRAIGSAHRAFYDALARSDLAWTLVCTPNIAVGDASAKLTAAADVLPPGSFQVTTGALAAFLLREAAEGQFVRSRVGVNGVPG
jgi:putative NADH-flavin reductase